MEMASQYGMLFCACAWASSITGRILFKMYKRLGDTLMITGIVLAVIGFSLSMYGLHIHIQKTNLN